MPLFGEDPSHRHDTLTVRDRFAMAALVGLWAGADTDFTHEVAARVAYEQADAMLKEREKS